MNLSEFDYDLPKELIAQYPSKERDACRLMVLDRSTGDISHRSFRDIIEYFLPGDALVLNDTRVLNCRLVGSRVTGGRVEVFLLRALEKRRPGEIVFDAMISHSRVKPGDKIFFKGGIPCTLTGKNQVSFPANSLDDVYRLGQVPLPPYIKRDPEPLDDEFYQTVYAAHSGSLAAPTAGLHFTPGLLDALRAKGVTTLNLTLHVGTATFKPVKEEDITRHAMGTEHFIIPAETIAALASRPRPRPERMGRDGLVPCLCAVGTTACRTLETCAQARPGQSALAGGGEVEGDSNLFIYPGYTFKIVNRLLTNFHLPKTTLFMLVCAFAGSEHAKKAYAEAVAQKYRFYSYGDAMLII